MSNIALFAVGTFVTLLVLAPLALLFWGAVLDGRYNDEKRAAETAADPLLSAERFRAIDPAQ